MMRSSTLGLILSSSALVIAGSSALASCSDSGGTSGTANSGGASASSGAGTESTAAANPNTTTSTASTQAGPTGSTGSSSGAGGGVSCVEAGGPIPPLKLTQIVGGLDQPAFVSSPPGDPNKLFVLELNGRIKIVENGAVTSTFLDISSDVKQHTSNSVEWGLLGMAFHPQYAQNGRFFLYYTSSADTHNRIYEYHRSDADPTKADQAPVKTFSIDLSHSAYNHNGGMMAFGPDGMMYASTGDTAVDPTDPANPAQKPDNNLGKILRIDVDSDSPPSGNLNGYVWDLGFRNPWRFSFDACKGDLYIGDVGQNCFEEVDVEPAGQGLKNYGWTVLEGQHCRTNNCAAPPNPPADCSNTGMTAPALEHSHSDGWVALTGGYVYRGAAIPGLQGVYIYGDYGTRTIHSMRYANGAATEMTDLTADLNSTSLGAIPSFGEDAAGNLYVVDLGGAIYRIDAE